VFLFDFVTAEYFIGNGVMRAITVLYINRNSGLGRRDSESGHMSVLVVTALITPCNFQNRFSLSKIYCFLFVNNVFRFCTLPLILMQQFVWNLTEDIHNENEIVSL
jgi:hypothetical protein